MEVISKYSACVEFLLPEAYSRRSHTHNTRRVFPQALQTQLQVNTVKDESTFQADPKTLHHIQ